MNIRAALSAMDSVQGNHDGTHTVFTFFPTRWSKACVHIVRTEYEDAPHHKVSRATFIGRSARIQSVAEHHRVTVGAPGRA